MGASYTENRLTAFTVARFRLASEFQAITWISGGSFRYYKGFNLGVAEVNFHAWVPKPTKYVVWNAPSVKRGYASKRFNVDVFRLLGGGGVRAAHDNWDFQGEYKLNKKFSLLGEVQSYQYKYPNVKKSPRSMDAEVDIGVKYYIK